MVKIRKTIIILIMTRLCMYEYVYTNKDVIDTKK